MKKFIIVVFLVFITSSFMFAQDYFQKGRTYLGPTAGISLGLGAGVTAEYGISESFGVGADIAYASFTSGGADFGMFAFLISGSYHWSPKKSFDPFIKLGLGYYNFKMSGILTDGTNWASGIGFSGATGFHYWFSPKTALRLQVGWPFLLGLGVDFKIGGK